MDTNGHIILCEDYVSFEIAKLLKEKEFKNEYCDNMLLAEDGDTIWKFATFTNKDDAFDATMKFKKQIPLVTHQLALKWLREVHKCYIHICPFYPDMKYHEPPKWLTAVDYNGEGYPTLPKRFDSYEQAVEAALKYTLENLI